MVFDFAEFDFGDGVLWRELYEKIKTAVQRGAVSKGERLPSVREAAAQLCVSRTTVEKAYDRLCMEGIVESQPQRGYFVRGFSERTVVCERSDDLSPPRFDFSSRHTDADASDAELWKKLVRNVLRDSGELFSYGDPQGEARLRSALAAYSYRARGVRAEAGQIVIGAGIGPLLNILCGLTGRDVTVGFEGGGFESARRIFADYGIKTLSLPTDQSGAMADALAEADPDVLFLMPSQLSKISVSALSRRRHAFADWAAGERLIIEDDYNGELRYTARSLPAFQGGAPDCTVYIGSFSKLLLPSVRLAYMVLPPHLSAAFRARRASYNQTCGKIEQLALCEYIESGALERQLRRLRRIYYAKSLCLCRELESAFPQAEITLFETSLTVLLDTKTEKSSEELCAAAQSCGVRVMRCERPSSVLLCFAGISERDIPDAVGLLKRGLKV